jgi:hypothetical protein
LDAAEAESPICNEGRHSPDVKLCRLLLIRHYTIEVLMGIKRLSQSFTVKSQLGGERHKHLRTTDVLSPFKESVKDGVIVLIKLALLACPVSRLMRKSRTWLYRRKPYRDV